MAPGFLLEKRALQGAVALGSLIPVLGGAMGLWLGPRMLGGTAGADLDSHFRYLSGLLLAIGLGYISTLRDIETKGARFTLLTALVVVGGLGRLGSVFYVGWPESPEMRAALLMELCVTPALALWQRRVSILSPYN